MNKTFLSQLGLLVLLQVPFVGLSYAAEHITLSDDYKNQLILVHQELAKTIASKPEVVKSVKRQSRKWSSLDEILQIDRAWAGNSKIQSPYSNNKLARYFREVIESPNYAVAEVLLIDGFGAIVSCTPVSTDFWQGDEDKFMQVMSSSQIYTSNSSWDQSSQAYSFFIGIPVMSKNNRNKAGVLVLGVDITVSYLSQMSLENLMKLEVR